MRRLTLIWTLAIVPALNACAPVPPPAAVLPPGPPFEQQLGWIMRLEDQRMLRDPDPPQAPAPAPVKGRPAQPAATPAPPLVPDLTAIVRDRDPRLRRRAALAIGRVGMPEGVDALVATLADTDPDVRQMACFALALLHDVRARDALVPLLNDPDVRVQGRAAEALGAIGDAAVSTAVGQMVGRHAADPAVASLAVDDLSPPVAAAADAFRLGLYALVRLKAWDPLAAAVLDANGVPRVRWWPVAYAVQRIEDKRAVPALQAFARGTGVDAVAFAARGFGVLKEPRGVEVLVPLLDPAKHDRRVVISAARALGQIADPRAAEPLLRLLRGPKTDNPTRLEVVTALGLVKGREAVDDLMDLIGHPDVSLRGAALIALANLDQDSFITVLSGLDPDPAWQVRADLARALAAIARERALPQLTLLLGDVDQRVVVAALRALGELKVSTLGPMLRDYLVLDDFVVRATAATLAGELRPAGGDEWLREAWKRAESDASYTARAAALSGLARYGLSAARPTLEEALTDRDWAVRLRAAQLLTELDPRADVSRMRPAPTKWTPADYERPGLITPPYSTQVYIDTKKGTVQIELLVLDAPLTVVNFIDLARKGSFNGVPIHRVVPNFVVQGGDPRGDGQGGPGYTIRDEINLRPYLRGTVGMALDWTDTGGSQFFITHGPQPHLDGRYTVFGSVVEGMDVVDRLERWDVIERVRVWDGVQPPEAHAAAARRSR